MRETLVLVLLFIVLSSGYIAPPGLSTDSSTTTVNEHEATINDLTKMDKINVNDLYITEGQDNKSNVNERSSIYINKKFRKHFRNQLYKILVPGISDQPKLFSHFKQDSNGTVETASPTVPKNSNEMSLFVPANDEVRKQYVPKLYPYEFPKKLKRYPEYHLNDGIITKEAHVPRTKRPLDRLVMKSTVAQVEITTQPPVIQTLGESEKELFRFYDKNSLAKEKPTNKKKMRISSYTNRVPSNMRCGFPEPSMLHRASFNTKSRDNYKALGNPSLVNAADNKDEADSELSFVENKLTKYIRKILEETGQTQSGQSGRDSPAIANEEDVRQQSYYDETNSILI